MADSIDRVFAHALSTVRKIPRTGSPRPPTADRLLLYGLYKQSTEGDVAGVMERPDDEAEKRRALSREEQAECEKWDAWSVNAGLSRTAAKRRYIDTLIATMRIYASGTSEARELINELEFVWDQVKGNPDIDIASSTQEGRKVGDSLRAEARSGDRDRLRVLRPMSEPEEEELEEGEMGDVYRKKGGGIERSRSRSRAPHTAGSWQARVDRALVQMTAEIAALREVVEARGNRLWRSRTVNTKPGSWIGWLLKGLWTLVWRAATDALILGLVVLALRWRRGGKEKAVETWKVVFETIAGRLVRVRRMGRLVKGG